MQTRLVAYPSSVVAPRGLKICGKRSSLLRYIIIYDCKKFYSAVCCRVFPSRHTWLGFFDFSKKKKKKEFFTNSKISKICLTFNLNFFLSLFICLSIFILKRQKCWSKHESNLTEKKLWMLSVTLIGFDSKFSMPLFTNKI